MNESQLQTELEAMQASERVARDNLRELARLVVDFDRNRRHWTVKEYSNGYSAMTNFAKGVAQ